MLCSMQDLSSPTRDLTLQWKCGVSTTGPPGKALRLLLLLQVLKGENAIRICTAWWTSELLYVKLRDPELI